MNPGRALITVRAYVIDYKETDFFGFYTFCLSRGVTAKPQLFIIINIDIIDTCLYVIHILHLPSFKTVIKIGIIAFKYTICTYDIINNGTSACSIIKLSS